MSLWLEILSKAASNNPEALPDLRFALLQTIRYSSRVDSAQPYRGPIEKMIVNYAAGVSDSEKGMIMSRLEDVADYIADLILSQVDRTTLLVRHVTEYPDLALEELTETFTGWLGLKRSPEDKVNWVLKHLASMSEQGVPLPVNSPAVEEASKTKIDGLYGYEEEALVRRWQVGVSWNTFKDQQELDYHFQSLSADEVGSESSSQESYDYGGLTAAKIALEFADARAGRSVLETKLDLQTLAGILNVDLRKLLENLHASRPKDGYRPIAWHNVWWNITLTYEGLPLVLDLKDPHCEADQKLADYLLENYSDVRNVNRLNMQRRRTRLHESCDEVILDALITGDESARLTTF